jgi:hypothetical protein
MAFKAVYAHHVAKTLSALTTIELSITKFGFRPLEENKNLKQENLKGRS